MCKIVMIIVMLVEIVVWICCRIRWWFGLWYVMLCVIIIVNFMIVEGNNVNCKFMYINVYYCKEII